MQVAGNYRNVKEKNEKTFPHKQRIASHTRTHEANIPDHHACAGGGGDIGCEGANMWVKYVLPLVLRRGPTAGLGR